MRMKVILSFLWIFCACASCLVLNSCQQQPKVDVKTMEYYLAHDAEREAVLRDCKNKGVSDTADTPEARNCRAALNARQHKAHEEALKGQFEKSDHKTW